MKHIIHILAVIVLLALAAGRTTAQPFIITASPDTQTVVGPTATIVVHAMAEIGFKASVFLEAAAPSLPNMELDMSPRFINSPYTDSAVVTLTLTGPKTGGTHNIIIKGSNGPTATYDTVQVTIPNRSAWTVILPEEVNAGLFMPSQFMLDKRNGIGWYQTWDSVKSFDGSTWRAYAIPTSRADSSRYFDKTPRGMTIDSSGALWVVRERALYIRRDSTWTVLDTADPTTGLTDQMLSGLFSMSGQRYTCIHTTPDSAVWIGGIGNAPTGSGAGISGLCILRYKDSSWTLYHSENAPVPIPQGEMEVLTDATGKLWIGAFRQGLTEFDGTYWSRDAEPSIARWEEYPIPFAADRNGWVWIRGRNTVYQYNGDSVTYYWADDFNGVPQSNKVAPSYIGRLAQALDIDQDGDIWVGMKKYFYSGPYEYEGGLARFDGSDWYHYTIGNSGLPNNNIIYMAVDANKKVWIITEDGGLTLLDGNAPPRTVFNNGGQASVAPSTPGIGVRSHALSIVPNPTTSNATLTVRVAESGRVLVQLVDVMGNVVSTLADRNCTDGSLSIPISTTDLPTGTYFVQYLNNQSVETVPLVVAK